MTYWDDDVILLELKTSSDKQKPFDQLVAKYSRYLCDRAYQIIKDEHVCKDIVQELFMEFYQQRRYNTIQSAVRACLVKQCRDRCLNYLKKKGRNEKKLEGYGLCTYKLERPHFTESFQIRKRLDNELNALPPQQQQAFDLVLKQGKKYREAAQRMGVSTKTCKNHYHRAITRLRTGLADLRYL